MHVAVAIVGYRNSEDIVRCLAALEGSTHGDFEVILCENGGPEAYERLVAVTPPALKDGQKVRLVLAPGNLGFAGGVNVCLRETPAADAWWILNPDTRPSPDALAAMLTRLRDGSCDAVGGPIHLDTGLVQSYGGRWQGWLARPVSIGYGRDPATTYDPAEVERTQNYLNGASMLVSKRFMETVGPMREDYFLYCEEVEWSLRAITRRMRLGFTPRGVVLHAQGATTGAGGHVRDRSRVSVYLGERNKMLLTRDCYPRRLPIAALAALATVFRRYALARATAQLGYGLSGWWAGLRNERGVPSWMNS